MTDCVLNPVRLRGEPEIQGPCLCFVNPGDTAFVRKEAEQHKARRHHLFHSNLYELSGTPSVFWAGPAMGAPAAVLCLEKLIACGADKVLVFGICGSLAANLKIGDVFIPTWCRSEEGTSVHYSRDPDRPSTNSQFREDLVAYLKKKQFNFLHGPIWTTDAPYRETKNKVKKYSEEGIMAVDMELSALAAVAHFRNIQLAAALLVSDELSTLEWRSGYTHKILKQNRTALFHILNKFLQQEARKYLAASN
jgi:uridine phosphorylase